MDTIGTSVDLTIPIFVDNDFGIDDDGNANILSFIYVDDHEDAIETKVSFDAVIDAVLEVWTFEPTPDAISFLNELAHVLHSAAERLWTASDTMEVARAEHDSEQYPML